jgi:tripartite-type tricarboxylate transporter receptor subunit TctC
MSSFLVAAAAAAQSYPNRPVKIVVSYPPGGVVDVLARPLAAGLQQEWGGNPVLVENRPGANAIIGTDYVARQPGDGHTLAGMPNFEARSWFGIAVPAGTPRAVIDKIAADARKIVSQPEYRKRFILDQGLEPFDLSPDQFAEYLVKDRAKYAERIKNANVRLD